MPVPETNVLFPRDPSLKTSDDWPAFSVTKARVVSQQTGFPVSLLSAHKGNPVVLTGRLEEVDDEFSSSIRDSNYRRHTIEIKDVTTYAFAEYEGGGYGFWAAGQAGWFEIEATSSEYKEIYEEMMVAASMLYFIADRTRRSRKSNFTQSEFTAYMKRQFKDYLDTAKNPSRIVDVDGVKKGFNEHRDFLIASMLESQEGLDWTGTPIMKYFQLYFPDDVARIRRRIYGISGELDSSIGQSKKKAQSSNITEAQAHSKKGRPQKDLPPLQPKTPVRKTTAKTASSDEDDYGNPNVVTRKRKSILQPSGSKYSKKSRKATGRRGSLPDLTEPTLSDNDEDEDEESTPSAEESLFTTIRNGDHLNLITNPSAIRASSEASPPPHYMPRKYLELKVMEYGLPSMESQGPGDLWTCTFEGCSQRIHKASTASGKSKIREHFKTHKSHAQEKIDLALDESRPYLPVNNLVRRLQAFAPSLGEGVGSESIGRQFTAPIRRKY